ncbi:helicase associated domain-containing protein [Paeniglutamicibacter antarcticus]|uniref:Helicase associated domain-containing protein n=1 Tax=Arthrobacter terrae TaxID=2935737 RepID=A0A931G4X6_9MICC|nr:helicase associated domain-containing protein [Arthrobacter terrae]MBG0738895.1 helicase associated domain-containing protein [Arthrobacter terrae]
MAVRVSSHTEWDLMYAAGLSCDRIARLCHAPRSTVFAYFRKRTVLDPMLSRNHEEHSVEPAARAWHRVSTDLMTFTADTGRWPNPAGEDGEAFLARWLAEQRRRHRRGELSADRIEKLDDAGPWRYSSRALADEKRWWTRLEEVTDYLREPGSWPQWKTAADEHERVLGVWLHEQRQKSARNILPSAKARALTVHLPGWNPRGSADSKVIAENTTQRYTVTFRR